MRERKPPRTPPWPAQAPRAEHRAAYAGASTTPFWLDNPDAPGPRPALLDDLECDLAIVGGGLSGLWAALEAKEAAPGREVVLLEGSRIAHAASGRNGGFMSSSLTHGVGNGMARLPKEMHALERLGLENFEEAMVAMGRLEIDCDLEAVGDVAVALAPHEEGWLAEEVDELRRLGHEVEWLDGERMREEVRSPLFRAGRWQRSGSALIDPAKLCWGLALAAERLGARIHEHTRVERIERSGAGVELRTPSGRLRARQGLLATSAFPALIPAIRRRVVPVYDYVLVSEPLSARQRESVGWRRRQGLSDSANRFHYYRLTADGRILWGGYDAIYNYGGRIGASLEQRERSFAGLAQRFFTCFPQLEGIRFTHRWGGAIDTCSRFFAFHDTALGGRVAYSVGHTGLGLGASRFGARVALDLLAGRDTETTRLRAVRSKPLPLPPEPLRWGAIALTRNRLAAADRNGGRRGTWLRTLDRAGLGFDS